MKSLFCKPVMWLLLGNDVLDNVGIWVRNMAILLYVGRITQNDPVALALVTLAELLPMFLLSLVGGAVADRFEPKRTIIIGGLLSAISVALLALAVSAGYWQAVFGALFVSAVASQFSQPSSMVVFKKNLAPDEVAAAISIDQTIVALLVIVGPMIGAWVFLAFGMVASLGAVTALFILSTVLALFLPRVNAGEEAGPEGTLWQDIKAGVGYLFSQRRLRIVLAVLLLFGAGNGLCQPLDLLVLRQRLNLGEEFLQWMIAATGVGMVAGGILSSLTVRRGNYRAKLMGALALMSACLAGYYLSPWFPLTVALHFANGLAIAFVQSGFSTVMLNWVEESFVGRVSGLVTPAATGALCVGSALSGLAVLALGLVGTGLAAAAFILAGALTLLALRRPEYAPAPGENGASPATTLGTSSAPGPRPASTRDVST